MSFDPLVTLVDLSLSSRLFVLSFLGSLNIKTVDCKKILNRSCDNKLFIVHRLALFSRALCWTCGYLLVVSFFLDLLVSLVLGLSLWALFLSKRNFLIKIPD